MTEGTCPLSGIAEIYAALGETELALDWLDTAWEDRASQLAHIREYAFEAIEDEPRYLDLLARLAFPDR